MEQKTSQEKTGLSGIQIVGNPEGAIRRIGSPKKMRHAIVLGKCRITLEDVWSLREDRPIVACRDCGSGETDSFSVAFQLFHLGDENVNVLKDPSIKGWKGSGFPMAKSQ